MLVSLFGIFFHAFEIPLLLILLILSFIEVYAKGTKVAIINKNYVLSALGSLVLYIFVVALSIIAAKEQILVMKSVVKWTEVFIIANLIFIYSSKAIRIKYLYWTLFGATFLLIFTVYLQVLFGQMSLLSYKIFPGYESVFSMALLLPFVKLKKSKLTLSLFLLCCVALMLSQSRGAYLAALICVMYFFKEKGIRLERQLIIFAAFALIIMLIPVTRTLSLNIWDLVLSDKIGSNTERLVLARLAVETFFNNPLIGVGSLNFPVHTFSAGIPLGIVSENIDTLGPHNTFLQVAAEEGILGVVVFSFFLFIIVKLLWKRNSLDINELNYSIGLKLFFLAMFFNLFFGFITSQHRFYMGILLGLSLAASRVYLNNRIILKSRVIA